MSTMAATIRLLACGLAVWAGLCVPTAPVRAAPATYATPEAAVSALKAALAKNDVDALLDIFGREHSDIILGADPVSGDRARRRANTAVREGVTMRRDAPDRITLVLGKNKWPMTVPLVRDGDRWRFDSAAGRDEILARRIGEDELAAIDALKAFVEAQRKYAAARRAKGQSVEYAQYIQSTPGRTDGLWWDEKTAADSGPSPLAQFVTRNRGFLDGRQPGDPFKGYFFRMLTAQGAHARGGTMSYLAHGRMTKGFALIAWPANYATSGIMTFLVGPDGRVLEKDLGERTPSLARTLLVYDPGQGWAPAERRQQ
jgi:hypothetical protein